MKQLKNWIYRNARPLDLALYQYHFEGASAQNALTALAAYQNADGGFGSGLEADCWNPVSSPMQTWRATQVLLDIGKADAREPIVSGIAGYLHSGDGFARGRWQATIPSNNACPHASWWTHADDEAEGWGDNPTGALSSFLLKVDPGDDFARNIARAAADRYIASNKTSGSDLLKCMYRLVQAFPEDEALKNRYVKDALASVETNPAKWGGYACRPSSVLANADNPAYPFLKEAVAREAAYIRETRNADGVWAVPWNWGAYDREFAVAENWWKSEIAMNYARFLRAFGFEL